MRFSVLGSNRKWPSSTTFRSQSSKVVSVKKDAASTSPAWVKHWVLNVIQIPFKLILLNESFLPENPAFTLLVLTVRKLITLRRTATKESLKYTTPNKPAKGRSDAAAAAEG